jgi:precorrin-2 dehydrogenase/sirohydrochlorin ferrochelatase
MLPLVLTPHGLKVGLLGLGEARERRAALLAEAGVEARVLPPDPSDEALSALQLLADRARRLGVLVNVEDVLTLCDFHVPAIVRRGDLLLTASTGGQVPGLSRALRETLSNQFGPEWTVRLKELRLARARWRSEGLSPADVSQMVRAFVEQEGWL